MASKSKAHNKCVNADRFTHHFVLGKTAGYANRYADRNKLLMSDYKQIKENIRKLNLLLPSTFSGKVNFKEIWNIIKSTNFKGANFPSSSERQEAWDEFQSLVDKIKELQEEENIEWDKKKDKSRDFSKEIIRQARYAKPSSNFFENALLTIATMGSNYGFKLLLHDFLKPFDDKKYELQNYSERLKEGWEMFSDYKQQMFGEDKSNAFKELRDAQETLNQAWDTYKSERQSAYDDFQKKQNEKRKNWVRKMEGNIQNLDDRRDRLESVLNHRKSHLSDLRDKLYDANSDNYRDRVQGWISEEESNIDDIKEKLSNVEGWINEAYEKINE